MVPASQNGDDFPSRLETIRELGSSDTALRSPRPDSFSGLGVPATWNPPAWPGPRLRVLHGPEAGRRFLLRGEPDDLQRGWVIGSGDEVDVRLVGDRFIEDQAADIDRTEEGFELVDLRTAELPVSVNGASLSRGEHRPIEDGDLIGIGESLMLFRA